MVFLRLFRAVPPAFDGEEVSTEPYEAHRLSWTMRDASYPKVDGRCGGLTAATRETNMTLPNGRETGR